MVFYPRKYHVNPRVLDGRPGVGAKIARSALCSSGEPGDGFYLYAVLSCFVTIAGWWFQTFFYFPFHIWDVILPIDVHIFQDD